MFGHMAQSVWYARETQQQLQRITFEFIILLAKKWNQFERLPWGHSGWCTCCRFVRAKIVWIKQQRCRFINFLWGATRQVFAFIVRTVASVDDILSIWKFFRSVALKQIIIELLGCGSLGMPFHTQNTRLIGSLENQLGQGLIACEQAT